MQTTNTNIDLYKKMSVLVVDDDGVILQLFQIFLENIFKEVVQARDGEKGLEAFKNKDFDLVITDYNMPLMNGLELIQNIRNLNKTIPIIFVTSSEEYTTYQVAINLNVTHSLCKPISEASINMVLSNILEPIFSYRTLQKIKKEELEALKVQKVYDNHQQEQAFLKERQAIKNDFYYNYYHVDADTRWYLDNAYKPHDILSGDAYSIRALDENRAFFFIIDAMGKGVSASVTSILASSYINHLIDLHKQDLDFKTLLHDFNSYIIKTLLEEEVLAVMFAEFNFKTNTIDISSYGMPPVLMCNEKNELLKVKTNNLPISRHNNDFNLQRHDLKDIVKILFSSDGLVESTLDNGELYFSHLKEDFQKASSHASFLKTLYAKIPHPDDDITLLFFQKKSIKKDEMISLHCLSSLKEIDCVIANFEKYLHRHISDEACIAKLCITFSEIIMNAYEHGNLDISHTYKKELILKETFNEECAHREKLYGTRKIKINYLIQTQGEGKTLYFDIEDEGEGFDTQILKKLIFDTSSVSGRGFKIAKKMVDAIYYSHKGNHVILEKYFTKDLCKVSH